MTPPSQRGPAGQVVFVCWGNICRSPMAERVAERYAADAGLTDVVFTSAATSREEIGAPIDPRARRVLAEHGYRADDHAAHQITPDEIEDADLVIAAETIHVDRMLRMAPDADNLHPAERLRPGRAGGFRAARPLVRRARGLRGHARRRRGRDARRARGGAAPPALTAPQPVGRGWQGEPHDV